MFFDELTQIPDIAMRTSCAIFVVPPDTPVALKHALYLRPDESKKSTTISVDQMRDFLALTSSKETTERFFIITPADSMNEAAQNAFLKTFEEPHPHCHFVLLTSAPSLLLPTIFSRAQLFLHRLAGQLDHAPAADAKVMSYAKRLVAATPSDLLDLATELSKIKTKPREQAQDVVATAIELLYKSYFKTQNAKFLTKIPKLIALHNHLAENGHLKLHLVADLL